MNKTSQIKNSLWQYLHDARLDEARDLFAILKRDHASAFEDSEFLYLEAKLDLYAGQYLKATAPLQALLFRNPAHLPGLCDLALCYYQIGLLTPLKETLHQAHELLKEQAPSMASQEVVDQAIFIAKLQEESGCIEDANRLLDMAIPLTSTPKQLQAVHVQQLRLAVEEEELKPARELYQQIVSGTKHTLSFEVEREHSLLLADNLLFGLPQAWERFAYLLEQNLLETDRQFLSSEIAEQIILAGDTARLATLKLNTNSESEYEKNQARLITRHLQGEKTPGLSTILLEKALSPVSLLRLLRQMILLFPDSPERDALITRYRFHCMNLPSKKMAHVFLSVLQELHEEKIVVNSDKKSLIIGNRKIPLKSSLFWRMIPLFDTKTKEADLDKVIQAVYQEKPNAQHYDRLRMGISRLNTNLTTAANIGALFKVSKNSVTLLIPLEEKAS